MLSDTWINQVAEKVIDRLLFPTIEIEASGRHVHLTRKAVEILFGKGYQLTWVSDLSQPGQFVCKERLTVVGPKRSISGVVVLGPERSETQVEVSATDALALGIHAPVRMSGDIATTPGAKLIGPAGELELPDGVIVAMRHIHITPEDSQRFGVHDGQSVQVQVEGERSLIFNKTVVRVSPKFATYMHIDYDEANACGFSKGMRGTILLPGRDRNG